VAVKLAFWLPTPTFATSLLFDPLNNPMALLIAVVFFHIFPASSVKLAVTLILTLSACACQSISPSNIPAILTFILPLFAFVALFHFCPFPLVSHSQPSLASSDLIIVSAYLLPFYF